MHRGKLNQQIAGKMLLPLKLKVHINIFNACYHDIITAIFGWNCICIYCYAFVLFSNWECPKDYNKILTTGMRSSAPSQARNTTS
jgi:hypothetical protein